MISLYSPGPLYFYNVYDGSKHASILALDLEGTLITNIVSVYPRPGLKDFLHRMLIIFPEVVMYSYVKEEYVKEILEKLEKDGYVPVNFSKTKIYRPLGDKKDLSIIGHPSKVILVDDMKNSVCVEKQRKQVIHIKPYVELLNNDGSPSQDHADRELEQLSIVLEKHRKNIK